MSGSAHLRVATNGSRVCAPGSVSITVTYGLEDLCMKPRICL